MVTIFPGDGIGPEISKAVQHIFEVSIMQLRRPRGNVPGRALAGYRRKLP